VFSVNVTGVRAIDESEALRLVAWEQASEWVCVYNQWHTQEFCSVGEGFNKFSLGQRTERTGIWGR